MSPFQVRRQVSLVWATNRVARLTAAGFIVACGYFAFANSASNREATVLHGPSLPEGQSGELLAVEKSAAAPQQAPLTSSAGQAWPLPCFDLTDNTAALLDDPRLAALKSRSEQLQAVSDWSRLAGQSRQALQSVFFAIPKVIHQVWLGTKPEPSAHLDTWRRDYLQKCPGWRHITWNQENIANLTILDRTVLKRADGYAGRADVLRGVMLYEHGGVYIDADTQWVNGHCLDDVLLLAGDTGFLAAVEPTKPYIANGVIAAVKHHPMIVEYMHAQRILQMFGRSHDAYVTTGPYALSAAMALADNVADSVHCAAAGATVNTPERRALTSSYYEEAKPAATSMLMTVLHSHYFYPVYWFDHSYQKVNDIKYVAQLAKEKYPAAIMYQLGFTTNNGGRKQRPRRSRSRGRPRLLLRTC